MSNTYIHGRVKSANFNQLVLQNCQTDFDDFWCKMKLEFYLSRFCALYTAFVQWKTTKTSREVQNSVFPRLFFRNPCGMVFAKSVMAGVRPWPNRHQMSRNNQYTHFRQLHVTITNQLTKHTKYQIHQSKRKVVRRIQVQNLVSELLTAVVHCIYID